MIRDSNLATTWALARQRLSFRGSASYWEKRYRSGGTSGQGSYGELASYKAQVLNRIVNESDSKMVIEFGCGDGNQLSLMDYPQYIGLDVSESALQICARRFAHDHTKSFFLYAPDHFIDNAGVFQADLSLSLDVVYHLVEDAAYNAHLRHLFQSARSTVVVYSTDLDLPTRVPHVRHRHVTADIAARFPDWTLAKRIEKLGNAKSEDPPAEFFIYARIE